MENIDKNTPKHLLIIESWIEESINNLKWKEFYDIHIDDIDRKFKKKSLWIDASIYIKNIILNHTNILGFELMLVIPLCYKNVPDDAPISLKQVVKEFDITPPSFYLLPTKSNILAETIKNTIKIDFMSDLYCCEVVYKEDLDSDEYARYLYCTNWK